MTRIKLSIFLIFFLIISLPGSSQILIDWNEQYSYFKGTSEPSQPITLWYGTGFNSSAWPVGDAPFRYGDGSGGTLLSDMMNNYTTLYIRKNFEIADTGDFDEIHISVDYDDGFVLWINGSEVIKNNAPSNLAYNQSAPNNHESGETEVFILSKSSVELLNGQNSLAIQGFNVSKTSTDFYLDVQLKGIKRLPETEPVTADMPSGFYSNPFSVTLTGLQPGETIKYTLDGSDPRYSEKALTALSPVTATIDPNSTQGERGKTGGVVLRASKFKTGFEPSIPVTRTYIFINSVITQTHPGGGWPVSNINGQLIDLPMDTKVTTHDSYKYLMENALLDIPTISVTTDPENLFDSQKGIYVNAQYHGRNWERPANIELINPDGNPGFNIDAGLRIRGGWSRHPEYPKHAFRVFFRSLYGEGKLDFPLFGNEGVDEFDKIDLRTSQNYSWANGGSDAKHNTMNRDVFSRETQRDMNQHYTRSRYYHLYLNGLYWGVFQTQERAESNYAETYFGGVKEDYDVIKVDIGDNWNLYEIEATDGNTDAWETIWTMTQQGFASNLNYFKLLGRKTNGERDPSLKVWIDIDNFIDYMLTIFYAGNFDAPVSKFSNNYNPNNFYAIYNRTNPNEGFKFFIHDAEHTLLTDPAGPGSGLYENRVSIGMNVTRFEKFHPQWLHHRLTENKEYRLKFADRVYRHFFNNGALTVDSCIARFKKTADQLDLAIIAESARWGDSKSSIPRTKITDWLPAVNRVTDNYMPFRSQIVLNQLLNENLYNPLKPPVYKNNGTEIFSTKIQISENQFISLENPNSTGSVIYTTNGTDPRAVGGALSVSALDAGSNREISVSPGSRLMARTKDGETWSPLHELVVENINWFAFLKVTELHYHPSDFGLVEGTDLEFIELKNTGNMPMDLSGLSFITGIYFTFPPGSTLAPGSHIVLASDRDEFKNFYGFSPHYEYSGQLSNAGEQVILVTANNLTVFDFTYYDHLPWPVEADGQGYSLVSKEINPEGNPNDVDYWTLSGMINGSPMDDDLHSVTSITEVHASNVTDFILYPNPADNWLNIDFYLNDAEKTTIELIDLNGRLLHSLAVEHLQAGYHSKQVNLSDLSLASGLYLITFRTSSSVSAKKLVYNSNY
jgi:hypothetical protein